MSTKKDKFSIKDKFYMELALDLARAREGLTGPNPSVGCVIVKNDELISIGQTSFNGRPHAELNAIKNSIRNIILTPIGSRAFNPSFGTKIQTLLFEHPTPVTAIAIRSEIKIALQRLEPRVKVTNIEVFQREFDTDYEVSITFIAGYAPDEEISFTLNRLR